jgi:tetratricopeptide (TPR) repeat protein
MTSSTIIDLKSYFEQGNWSQAIPALRQDALVWGALQDSAFRGAANEKLGPAPQDWTPANLALILLEYKLQAKDLRDMPDTLPDVLLQRAEKVYSKFRAGDEIYPNLNHAGLLAIALREKPQNWGRLKTDPLLRCSEACLFSLIAQPADLLQTLPIESVIHVLFANPLENAEKLNLLEARLDICEASQRLDVLNALRSSNPELAVELTHRITLPITAPTSNKQGIKRGKGVTSSLEPPISDLQSLIHQADFQHLAANPENARAALRSAQQAASQIHTTIALQTAQATVQSGKPEDALELWEDFSGPESQEASVTLALTLMEHGYFDQAATLFQDFPPDTESSPAALLASARLAAHQAEFNKARVAAKQAVSGYSDNPQALPESISLLSLLLDLNLNEEAIALGTQELAVSPNNAQAAHLLARAYLGAGLPEEALSWAHLSSALEQHNIVLRRGLADTLENLAQWNQALQEREDVLALQQEFHPADHHALAACALQAGQPQRVQEIAQKIIRADAFDGQAHTLLGEALIAQEEIDQGRHHLEKAVQLAPEKPGAWLALAKIHQQSGNFKKQQQILLSAASAATQSAEIHLALGDAFQAANASTKSLTSYRRAFELSERPKPQVSASLKAHITCRLGQTLLDLGHTEDASHILEEAYRQSPAQANIAHGFARALIKQGQMKNALTPLAAAAENAPDNLDIQQDLAYVQYETRSNLEQAELTLKHILKKEPQRWLAKGLLAQVFEKNNKKKAALEMYNLALGTQLTKDPDWYKQLALGLSRMALALNQPDTALAALELAWRKHPENSELARNLATVYMINQLPDKALHVASETFQSNLTNLEIVCWFVNFALELKKPKQALLALEKAILIQPNVARLYLTQADIQLQLGVPEAAHKAFDQIASMDNASARELSLAADGLMELKDPQRAIPCLERALTLSSVQPNQPNADTQKGLQLQLYTKLAEAHTACQEHHAALEALEEAIAIRPNNPQLEGVRASLLVELGQLERAAAWIQAALDHSPEDPDLNLQAARIQRSLGNLAESHRFMDKTLAEGPESQRLDTIIFGAQLAMSMMQPSSASQILGYGAAQARQMAKNSSSSPQDNLFDYYCLVGEVALSQNEEIAAADALTTAMQMAPKHARILALKSRLRLRQGGLEDAEKTLENAMKAMGPAQGADALDVHISLAMAAIECQAWSPAVYLLNKAVNIAPQEPRPHLELARTLVLRAEHQYLCETVHINRHAPGPGSRSEETYRQFETAIMAATQTLREIRAALEHPEELQAALSTWLARGQAIFQPSSQHAHALADLEANPANQAAHLAALRHTEAMRSAAQLAAEIYPTQKEKPIEHPQLLGQMALALQDEEPEWASQAAQAALNIAVRKDIPNYALYFALTASVAHHIQDQEALLNAIQGLLTVWDDEPYWHTLAAETLLNKGVEAAPSAAKQAIGYLDRAIQLEPLKVNHYKQLGQAHFNNQDIRQALQAFKRAATLAPEDHEPNMELGRVFKASGDNQQANQYARKAFDLAPKNLEARRLLAQVAIDNQAPEEALMHADELLKKNAADFQAMLVRAEALTMLEKPAEALIALEAATARMLPTTDLLLDTITLKRQVYGQKAALESLLNLAGQYPHDLEIAFELTQALADRGKSEEAIQAAQKALNNASNQATPEAHARLHTILGRLLRRSGQLDQAVGHLTSALDHHPEWIEPYIELGRAYYERRQYDLALQTYQQAIRIAPTDGRAYHWAGVALKETNDYLNAEIMLRKAADLEPDEISIQRKLATVVALNLVHNPAKQVKTPIKTGTL